MRLKFLINLVKNLLSYIIKNKVVVKFVIFSASTIAIDRTAIKLELRLNFNRTIGFR